MRAKLLAAFLFLTAIAGYIAAPFYTAWTIRDAAKTGKADVLARSVYWPTVKISLKSSLREFAGITPQNASVASDDSPGFFRRAWTSFKTSMAHSAVDRLVERYANPTGFAQVFSYGRTYRTSIRRMEDPEKGLPLWQKIQSVWARVQRAEFKSLTHFELDMRDKYEPDRMYSGVLQLRNFRWMLTKVEVRKSGIEKAKRLVANTQWLR